MAFLAPCLDQMRDQFDEANSRRDKASDGWIGDLTHCPKDGSGTSDHCPDAVGMVHAIDVDEDLGLSGVTMMQIVRRVVENCRAGRETRVQYVIYERTIWSASWGWTARTYTGVNPHDKHAHFSSKKDSTNENSRRKWDLGVDEMTPEEVRIAVLGKEWPNPGQTLAGTIEAMKVWTQTLLAKAAAEETRDAALKVLVDRDDLDEEALKAHIDVKVSETNIKIEALMAGHQAELDEIQQQNQSLRDAIAQLPGQLAGQLPDATEEQIEQALNELLPNIRLTQAPEPTE